MRRGELSYFNAQWRSESRAIELTRQKAAREITRSQYNAELDLVKQDVLNLMVRNGIITQEELTSLTTLRTLPQKPAAKPKVQIGRRKSSTPKKRKRVLEAISRILPTHGKVHKFTTLLKYTSEVPGGLPGLGKK